MRPEGVSMLFHSAAAGCNSAMGMGPLQMARRMQQQKIASPTPKGTTMTRPTRKCRRKWARV